VRGIDAGERVMTPGAKPKALDFKCLRGMY